jgi:hypothetical protein
MKNDFLGLPFQSMTTDYPRTVRRILANHQKPVCSSFALRFHLLNPPMQPCYGLHDLGHQSLGGFLVPFSAHKFLEGQGPAIVDVYSLKETWQKRTDWQDLVHAINTDRDHGRPSLEDQKTGSQPASSNTARPRSRSFRKKEEWTRPQSLSHPQNTPEISPPLPDGNAFPIVCEPGQDGIAVEILFCSWIPRHQRGANKGKREIGTQTNQKAIDHTLMIGHQ